MDSKINHVATYFLRTPDGTIYGPVDLVTLCIWAVDARVIPGCELSERQDVWFPVETIPELRLNWTVKFGDGTLYGPLNLLAIRVLSAEKSIPAGASLTEKGTMRAAILDESLLPLYVEEYQQMLAGCGTLMTATLGAIRGALQMVSTESAERAAKLVIIQEKLTQTEHKLAATEIGLTEAGARCAAAEDSVKVEQAKVGNESAKVLQLTQESAVLSKRLHDAELVLKNKEDRIQQLEAALTQGKTQSEIQAIELRANAALLKTELQETKQRADRLASQCTQAQAETRKANVLGQAALQELMESHQKALQEVVGQREAVRGQLDRLQGEFAALEAESGRKEAEAAAKLKRIEQEIKDSTELVAKTMREMERRESQLQTAKNAEVRSGTGFTGTGGVVEVEVIDSETLHAETLESDVLEPWDVPAGPGAAQERQSGKKAGSPGVLNHVEAKLQAELRQWEALNRDSKKQEKTSCKWF